jgi:hypothetical protein
MVYTRRPWVVFSGAGDFCDAAGSHIGLESRGRGVNWQRWDCPGVFIMSDIWP